MEYLHNESNPVNEAYKVLRSNIQFSGCGKAVKTLMVTSCISGEGKTTTAMNLAASMASAGMKVAFIDADLRKATPIKELDSQGNRGLSHFLSGYAAFDEITKVTPIDGLYYISSGVRPPNPAELISSVSFDELLAALEEKFDVAIIDTPPLGCVIDAAIIGAKTHGAIIVIEANAIEYKNVLQVKEQLEKAQARVLGVILNKVTNNGIKGYKYYTYEDEKRETRPQRWMRKLLPVLRRG